MAVTPQAIYDNLIQKGALRSDVEQSKAVKVLSRLYDDLLNELKAPKKSFFARITGGGQVEPPQGVYMYGGVGRGKSMLMDLFFDALPDGVTARRVHFHEFMIEVHDYIHSRRTDDGVKGMVDQALPSLATLIARRSRVLCFDEFHVVDITDAMILGRLFKILFEHGVVVVATSNWAPDDLYKDGLQRDRFLPFIALFKTKIDVVHLDSPHDYRAETKQVSGTYFSPLNHLTRKTMNEVFKALINGQSASRDCFTVKGRDICARESVDGYARFSFSDLCERPHGAEDYLEIARRYHTVFLENIPKLSYDRRNEAKRLMNLIDALYEGRVRVIISADAPPDKLYVGRDHAYEFERTVSRLLEMQSDQYP